MSKCVGEYISSLVKHHWPKDKDGKYIAVTEKQLQNKMDGKDLDHESEGEGDEEEHEVRGKRVVVTIKAED